MFSNWFLKVLERMYGRKLASMIATASDHSVTERTVRNWIGKRTIPDPERVDQLLIAARAKLLADLETKGWTADQRDSFADGIHTCPGIVSGLAFTLQGSCGQYPAFLQLAREIDLLEHVLAVHRESGDLQGWVQTLLDAKWIRDEHLTDPDDDAGGAQGTRRQLYEAKSWEDLATPLSVLFINTQLQLLATLDLEFCSCYLPDFEAAPVFESLLPRLDPRVDLAGKTEIRPTRDLYHFPMRRLLETVACIRAAYRVRKWPRATPTVEEMAVWLELADQAALSRNLVKWRSGRAFTAARFLDIWDACFHFLPEARRPPAPMPMMYAAAVFTEMFVKGSREERDLRFVSPDPAFYRHWWDIQRRELATGPNALRFGTEKWMPGLE